MQAQAIIKRLRGLVILREKPQKITRSFKGFALHAGAENDILLFVMQSECMLW